MDVRRLNDNSREHLIAVARYSSLLTAIGVLAALALGSATGRGRWFILAVVFAAWSVSVGYVGWWHFGNASWRESDSGKRQLPGELPRAGGQG